ELLQAVWISDQPARQFFTFGVRQRVRRGRAIAHADGSLFCRIVLSAKHVRRHPRDFRIRVRGSAAGVSMPVPFLVPRFGSRCAGGWLFRETADFQRDTSGKPTWSTASIVQARPPEVAGPLAR